MIDLIHSLKLTPKALNLLNLGKYSFEVDVRLTKPKIKSLIEEIYGTPVLSVCTHRKPRKKRRRFGRQEGSKPKLKIAIVTLKPDFKIPIY